MTWFDNLSLFTLGVSSILPLVNPVGTALIVNPYFADASRSERKSYSFAIVFSAFFLGLATLLLGSWCLKFMGVSIPTTQMAGGLLIARLGLGLLNSESDSDNSHAPPLNVKNSLFYPMAFPLTVGPGVISALITLSAHAQTGKIEITFFRLGIIALALLAVMAITYVCLSYSDFVIRRIGSSGSLVLNRLMAFLIFCIGIQMVATGLTHLFPKIFGDAVS